MVFTPDPPPGGAAPDDVGIASTLGVDLEMERASLAKRVLFAPIVVAADKKKPQLTTTPAVGDSDIPTAGAGIQARSIQTPHGLVGHLRIYTFSILPDVLITEIERLIPLLPPTML